MLLFHGTKQLNVDSIRRNGLQIEYTNRGLFGRGIYFSDSAQKADQYADDPFGRSTSTLYMFVARVQLGRAALNQQDATCDSVLGGLDKRFREFVVFKNSQCLPIYLIEYERV